MESNMDKVKQSMKDKVPEIERSLDLVRHLQERQVNMDVSWLMVLWSLMGKKNVWRLNFHH